MTRTARSWERPVNSLLSKQAELITRSQAFAAGMTESALRNRVGPGGRWTVILPGVYLARTGPLTGGQREMAAVLYAGPGCVITGPAALRRQGVAVPSTEDVDVLIPAARKRGSANFVRVHRTRVMPERVWAIGGLRYSPCPRAIADTVRGGTADLRATTQLVAAAVQKSACTIEQLAAELRAGASQGSATLRAVLAAVADGVASVAESDFRGLIKSSGLPAPIYNPQLYVGDELLGRPDAWWPDAGVAAEVDSREWHLSPADWKKTMARHSRMSARGIIVLHFPPSRIRSDAAGVVAELSSALEAGRRRERLHIRTVVGPRMRRAAS